ncbi:hypothetical protein GCM10007933_18690 [Zoogloea oryzae]|uniref:Uncharacterized protein n=1 Tax=Zoogloea oryzae TaxID=310767 RepID=A0ABQ6FCH2_9RHOO|nr:hypothetical protein [Zoogloea oryzae]GLT22410.1 hypothetical protein GCM10007933_18690 [Zoogloea oryzae]
MTQNLISLDLSADDVAEFDAALAVIETFVKPLLSLTAEEAKGLSKMGDKSEQFCRQAAMLLGQNRDMLPATFPLDEMVSDLASFDVLRPRAVRLHDAVARLDDTLMALGSDVMVAASKGYGLMQMFGKDESLTMLQDAMLVRRPGKRKSKDSPAA